MKILELAAELNKPNKEVLARANELGIDAKSTTKNLNDSDVQRIKDSYESKQNAPAENLKSAPKGSLAPIRKPRKVVEAEKKAHEAEITPATQEAQPSEPEAVDLVKPADAIAPEAPKETATAEVEAAASVTVPVTASEMAPVKKEEKPAPAAAKPKEPAQRLRPDIAKAMALPPRKKPELAQGQGQNQGQKQGQNQNQGQGQGQRPKPAGGQQQGGAQAKTGEKPKSGLTNNEKKGHSKAKKDQKPVNEGFNNSAKKRSGIKDKNKKGGLADDFRGSRKSPILEDKALEKKTIKSRPRPKHHPREEEVLEAEVLESLSPDTVIINVPITVAGLSEQTERSNSEIIMALMKMGIMANVNQSLDGDTVELLAVELEIPIVIGNVEEEAVEIGLEDFEDKEEDLAPRPPIITVMGHVDHGKTSLLDAIRSTNVTDKEAGGITQHIGASEVKINGKKIVFLDTPGHEAFTAMRARGAHVTDIAVLVVAADDGVMPQTIESISHAKAANVPIIIAINKIDKAGANPDKVKQELADHGLLVEDWGGDIISVPVSAKSGEGITDLLEMILLQAEVMELRANPKRLAIGSVIEARLDKSKGAVATLLVFNGSLTDQMSVLAGHTSGKIRTMTDFRGKPIKKAGPSTAIEITGLSEVPHAGDEFHALKDDKVARDIAESRRLKLREDVMARTSGTSLESLYSMIQAGEFKELNLIIKGDVQGSVGALTTSLEKLENENVKVKIIHTGVGTVTESDIMLAETSGAIIIGFNVRPTANVASLADRSGVEIRTYRVIYDVIDDIENAMKGMLDPKFKEVVIGSADIRETFKVPGAVIGGAYVTDGKLQRNAEIRLVRDGILIHEGKISSLKRFKDDAKEVASGFECGIGIENYNDIKVGDVVEAFVMEEVERK
ncbi:MAG: translation initiation factor IF-2 [Clostridiales Family XIII bacterium]|jgi:translation initiation factor IF-2|nr:translation initiation factor IF-2 [Clostridiales Family XIII bacterium]